MAEQKYILFDFGASNGRCMVAGFDGERITMEEIHGFDNVPVNYAGVLYWDILRLVNELKIGIQKACKLYPDAVSIGIDTWGCDFAYIDKYGKLLANPVNYRDEARYRYKNDLDALFGGEYEVFKLGGANTNNIMSLYEFYANKREDSSALDRAERFLMMPDLLNYYLTGIPTNEYTNATMTLMVDQKNKKWEKEFINRLELPDKLFGELLMPGTQIAGIQKRVLEELEVPALSVIGVATHDTSSAIAGVPLSTKEDNWAFLSLGTWAIFGVESDVAYLDERTFSTGLGNQGGCEGKNNFVNLFTGLWVIQQCYERWNYEAGEKIGWDAVVKAVEQAQNSMSSERAFIDPDAPEFAQPNSNMPHVVQEYCKKRGMPVPQGMGEIATCIFESLVLKIKKCFHDVQSITGKEIEILHVFGGGSKNRVLCQWIADALKVQVKAGPAETTSVGNVLMQMKGNGVISSLSEGRVISAKSAESETIEYYQKGDVGKWEQYYEKYMKILKGE